MIPIQIEKEVSQVEPTATFGGTLTNSTAKTDLVNRFIPANRMRHPWRLRLTAAVNITTGILPPGLTVTLNLGASSIALTSGGGLLGSQNAQIHIEGEIWSTGVATQNAWLRVFQEASLLGSSPVRLGSGSWTEDMTADKTASLAAQFSAAAATASLQLAGTRLTLFGGGAA